MRAAIAFWIAAAYCSFLNCTLTNLDEAMLLSTEIASSLVILRQQQMSMKVLISVMRSVNDEFWIAKSTEALHSNTISQ